MSHQIMNDVDQVNPPPSEGTPLAITDSLINLIYLFIAFSNKICNFKVYSSSINDIKISKMRD